MEKRFDLNQLLQKPIAMMTGEELCFLIEKYVESIEKTTSQVAPITQIGRKIVVDADLALSLAKESGGIRIKE